jgi:hypothetical protein
MESHQNLSSFSSLQHLLEELENLIALESDRKGSPWISVTKLSELFCKKYGVSLEAVAKAQGYSDLRSLFRSSRRFSIYGTQAPQEYYVTLFHTVFPNVDPSQATSIRYRIKRSWKVDGGLLRLLKAEGAEEVLTRQAQRISERQSILVSEIKSVNDLKVALIEIIKSLIAIYPKKTVTIAVLSNTFYAHYRQPIRAVIQDVCPDTKLIELLQTIPSLHVHKVDSDWQITAEDHF